jgi:hypothetical protein
MAPVSNATSTESTGDSVEDDPFYFLRHQMLPPNGAPIGRRFRSAARLEDCLRIFPAAAGDAFGPVSEYGLRWAGDPELAPDALAGLEATRVGQGFHLAVWDLEKRDIIPFRRMAIVCTHGYDPDAPFPLTGHWFQYDKSVSRIGNADGWEKYSARAVE